MKRIIIVIATLICILVSAIYITENRTQLVYNNDVHISAIIKDSIHSHNRFRKTKTVYHFYDEYTKPLERLSQQIDTTDNNVHILVNTKQNTYFSKPSVYVTTSTELKKKNTQLPIDTYLKIKIDENKYEELFNYIDQIFNDETIKPTPTDYSYLYKPLAIIGILVVLFLVFIGIINSDNDDDNHDNDINDTNTRINMATTVFLMSNTNN